MKHECEVILDLLPLYHDGVCSEKSREMVEEHLKECEMCQKALAEIRKEISAPNVSRQDAGKAWKTLTRNLWIRRVAVIVLAVVMAVAAAAVGKEIYEWDQERTIWMGADELNIEAYRLADGRVYVEYSGKERRITNRMSGPMEFMSGTEEWQGDYGFRFGTNKLYGDQSLDTFGTTWEVIEGKNVENIVLIGANEKDISVICSTDDELPPATGEMEQRVAEWDAWMAEHMSQPGKGKE